MFVMLVRPSDGINKVIESKIVTGPNLDYIGEARAPEPNP